MTAKKILLQLDSDSMASTFDAVVATDSGIDVLLRQSGVTPANVTPLVHGLMFTRGGDKLKSSAIFVGGSDVHAAEQVLAEVCKTFFGPVRVSVMFDANGCNTTAVAAVLSAMKHLDVADKSATVLGGTGPVGLRVARLLGNAGCNVRVGSRDFARAQKAIHSVSANVERHLLTPVLTTTQEEVATALEGASLVIACGAAGVTLLDEATLDASASIRVAIDLNAVPPAGIESIAVHDAAREVNGRIQYGAIGVGGLKMKIHKAALKALFESNDLLLDADEIFAIGTELLASN